MATGRPAAGAIHGLLALLPDRIFSDHQRRRLRGIADRHGDEELARAGGLTPATEASTAALPTTATSAATAAKTTTTAASTAAGRGPDAHATEAPDGFHAMGIVGGGAVCGEALLQLGTRHRLFRHFRPFR